MTTVADWIRETKDHVVGASRQVWDELAVAVTTTTATSVTLTWAEKVAVGTVLSVGGEDMLVRTWDPGSKTATVRRGWRSSTAVTHAIAADVEIGPRFLAGQIKRMLLTEIHSWPDSLFRVAVTTHTLDESSSFLDYDTPVKTLLLAQYNSGQWDQGWHNLTYARLRPLGSSSRIDYGTFLGSAQSVEVHVGLDFDTDPWSDTTDLEVDVGLARTMLDIGPMGAALRLIGFSELVNTDESTQGESRWAEESPAGHRVDTMLRLWRLRNSRIAEEGTRLRARYPMLT